MASETTIPDEKEDSEHKSLKYSLLGPSLTKSGQDSVDQSKVCGEVNVHVYRLPNFIVRFPKLSTMLRKGPNTSTMKKRVTRLLRSKSSEY